MDSGPCQPPFLFRDSQPTQRYNNIMENTTTVVNNKGRKIQVDAQGYAFCHDCTGEHHPDDMRNEYRCLTCHDDLHSLDWTMEDC